ncbi:MAG TPA: response regulator [Bacteroidales bacterium]|nr:response regulator [Bacteroidales bacterium]
MRKPIRVLLIEDNEDDEILEVDVLEKGGFDVIHKRVDTPEDLKKALEENTWDCIISDYALPLFTGVDALNIFRETGIDIPFIIVSGVIGEETAVIAMKAGVHDYIMKTNLNRLIPALQRELREADVRRQKKQTEENIRFERQLLRTLIDNLPDLIYIKDTECRRTVANLADVRFAGYSSEQEMIGKTDIEIFNNEYGKRSHAADLTVLQTGVAQINYEEELTDKEGNKQWYTISKIPIYDSLNNISGLVAISHDITGRKKMEMKVLENEQNLKNQNLEYEALNKEYLTLNEEISESLQRIQKMNDELVTAKNKAEESDRLKSSFLANMSHEIRTPLNAILGFSSFLKNPELSRERIEEFVDIIDASGHQLLSVINDILEISQIESGHISITIESVNITKLLNELFILFKKDASANNLDIVLNINNSADDIITRTDGGKVRQVLINLLNNAIKFTHEGRVEFAARVAKNQVIFYVKDTGIGIDPNDQAIIFEPFRQVETTITRNYGGNGLGLSISRALVEKLGGKMTVHSIPKKGSTFGFTIPYLTDDQTATREDKVKSGTPTYNWKNHQILVAEDEIYNYRFIEEMLASTHVKVLHARDGKEAVEMVRNNPDISLVIMDLKMPGMDGYEATEIIKQIRPELPVIAQTATVHNSTEDAHNAGFDEYLSKPIEINSFMEVIDAYLDT